MIDGSLRRRDRGHEQHAVRQRILDAEHRAESAEEEVKRADVGATRCDPVATAVNNQEQDGQSGRDDERLTTFNAHDVRQRQ